MKRSLILHGHFYQPPRENPWWGFIDYQESASPHHNWNQRITSECYAACGASRVLNHEGNITAIINIYKRISFNFGPTLLSWLEEFSPSVYKNILDADAESLHRLGHGNAVAQSYNHSILPLDLPSDARTQIRWGLMDFEHRFGRKAEGMWLPECAVNGTVLDLLIDEKLTFIILSPWQAQAIKNRLGKWENLNGLPAPSNRPFKVCRPAGDINIFFYHPELASRISFGHLLRSREGFEQAIYEIFDKKEDSLLSIATDGEIYGHHEPYGDMCLAAFIDYLKEDSDLCFTNYATYLESCPVIEEIQLYAGNDGRGSSWSCSHGLGRWRDDCGCSTGGEQDWRQAWRAPLREAFDGLRDAVRPFWTQKIALLTPKNPREILDSYGAVLCAAQSPEEFIEKILGKKPSKKQQESLLILMEGVKFLHYMYSSCGWFFSELSGIETIQNMSYAYRAIELLDPNGKEGFALQWEELLACAKSNIKTLGSAKDLLQNNIIPLFPIEALVSAFFFWQHFYQLSSDGQEARRGRWKELNFTQHQTRAEGRQTILEGSIELLELPLQRREIFFYKAFIERNALCSTICVGKGKLWKEIPIHAMPTAIRVAIRGIIFNRFDNKMKKLIAAEVDDQTNSYLFVKKLELSFGDAKKKNLELSLYYALLSLLDELEGKELGKWEGLIQRLDRVLRHEFSPNIIEQIPDFSHRLSQIVSDVVEQVQNNGEQRALDCLVKFLKVVRCYGYRPVRPFVQNTVYALLCRQKNDPYFSLSKEKLFSLAQLVNINSKKFTGDSS